MRSALSFAMGIALALVAPAALALGTDAGWRLGFRWRKRGSAAPRPSPPARRAAAHRRGSVFDRARPSPPTTASRITRSTPWVTSHSGTWGSRRSARWRARGRVGAGRRRSLLAQREDRPRPRRRSRSHGRFDGGDERQRDDDHRQGRRHLRPRPPRRCADRARAPEALQVPRHPRAQRRLRAHERIAGEPRTISRTTGSTSTSVHAGAEIHFGFIGIPQLALQATIGAFLHARSHVVLPGHVANGERTGLGLDYLARNERSERSLGAVREQHLRALLLPERPGGSLAARGRATVVGWTGSLKRGPVPAPLVENIMRTSLSIVFVSGIVPASRAPRLHGSGTVGTYSYEQAYEGHSGDFNKPTDGNRARVSVGEVSNSGTGSSVSTRPSSGSSGSSGSNGDDDTSGSGSTGERRMAPAPFALPPTIAPSPPAARLSQQTITISAAVDNECAG